jgi:phosphohistidine phosphatase
VPTLVLLRHAKSDYPDGVGDHERPLADRGRREAPLAGSWLAERVPTFDLALVSTARRAQQTWQAVSASVAADEVRDDDELYLASSTDLLTMVRQLPGGAQSVLVVGHNEGLEELATLLSGVPVTLKTSTFAVLRSEAPWASWEPGSAHLTEVVVAR